LKIRRVSLDQDYAEIAKWWKDQGRAILSWELLPVLGFIAEENEKKIAVIWLYCSDSVVGFVGWTTVNPAVSKRLAAKALKLLQEAVRQSAHAAKLKMLFQFSGGGGFSRMLVKSGWKKTLKQHDFMMMEVR